MARIRPLHWASISTPTCGIFPKVPFYLTGHDDVSKDCLMKLFHAFIISNFNYCAIVWHFCSKSSTIKMEKIQKAALRVVFNDYDADYNQLLSMSERSPLLVVRLRTILVEVFKRIRELNPKFMNMLFTLNNKPHDTRSGPLLFQSHVKTIKHGINSFVYIKEPSDGIHCLPMPKILNALTDLRIS